MKNKFNYCIVLLGVAVFFIPSVAFAGTLKQEADSGLLLTVAAYVSLWFLLAAYLGMVFKRQRKVEEEILYLRRKIDKEIGLEEEG